MGRKSKGIYKKHDVETIQKAVKSVKSNQMSTRKATKQYGIAKSTLADYVSGRSTEGVAAGRPPIIPRDVENKMAEKIIEAADKGFGYGRKNVMQKAAHVAKLIKAKYSFKKGMPGRDWYYGFRRRHTQLTVRKPEKVNNSRRRLVNKIVVENYFKDLISSLEKLNLSDQPHKIWNMDEKNLRLEHKPSEVLAKRDRRGVPGRTGDCRESVTVIATVNALGARLPPVVIVKGKTHKSLWGWNTKECPEGTNWTYQEKANMEDLLGVDWFRRSFLPHIGSERPQLLLMDSHSSHEVTGLLEMARRKDRNNDISTTYHTLAAASRSFSLWGLAIII